MRRKGGTGLVLNETRLLAAALRLAILEGSGNLYGYELYATLKEWEGQPPMNAGTLYRCLRVLEARGLFQTQSMLSADGPPRVCYTLTAAGVEAARAATVQLAAGTPVPRWIDLACALPTAYPRRADPSGVARRLA